MAEGRKWVYQLHKIARRYVRTWLSFDVLTLLPSVFDVWAYVLVEGWKPRTHYGYPAQDVGTIGDLFLLRVVRGLRLVKLVRLARASRLLRRWQTRIAISWSGLRLISLLVTLLLTTHWLACFLAMRAPHTAAASRPVAMRPPRPSTTRHHIGW